ncbi:hypothetical protein OPKNFCMD_0307 [Methylobacterium crusticola]|uniref:DUF1007 family protein n=1 Tax=Methylobacterium crusticola TaxID=1697972 RepID=A0ABQ4QSB8_9HYPH|nr:DUF1007 family protein [Methylobacterium crusticola]GJD47599.1 hypothetical protein OPKNFCMD_0307 [Methylobacterium crusticola]
MIGRAAVACAVLCGAAGPALAHPHVWVRARTEVVLDARRSLVALRQSWTFDPEYSAFAVLNLDSRRDGVPDPDKLEDLARTRLEAMAETAFFTSAKVNGREVALAAGPSPRATYRDGRLTLDFTLVPQAPPAPLRAMLLRIDDPDFYVAFGFAPGPDAARLAGAPDCVVRLTRPAREAREGEQVIPDGEATGTPGAAAAAGADYSGRVLVACP